MSNITAQKMPKIAIIGGGPGGLTLGAILLKQGIPFTLFELDANASSRNQGGTLDLHPKEGQHALREAGLWDFFVQHARPEGDCLKLVKMDGTVCWDENTFESNNGIAKKLTAEEALRGRPEIDRTVLRDILLKPLVDADRIVWGKHLVEITPSSSSSSEQQHDLHFADGSVETGFDLVIGADGAWSRVRKLLSNEKPFYSGITLLDVVANSTQPGQPQAWMPGFVGAGSMFSFDEGRAVQSQRIGDGSIRTYASVKLPESWIAECKAGGFDWAGDARAARDKYVATYFHDCDETIKRLVLESNDTIVPRHLFMLPVGFKWEHKPGLTLLGDAAHLMTPFAGVGVNAAMADAVTLAQGIVDHAKMRGSSESSAEGPRGLSDVVRKYEEEMFPRGEMFAQKTAMNLKSHFSEGGVERMVDRLKKMVE